MNQINRSNNKDNKNLDKNSIRKEFIINRTLS